MNDFIQKYGWIINIILITFIAWVLAAFAGTIIKLKLRTNLVSKAKTSTETAEAFKKFKSQFSYNKIVDRNIFDSENRAVKKSEEAEEIDRKKPTLDLISEPVLSNISAKLIGTLIRSDGSLSSATIQASGETDIYHIGDKILGEADIIEIQRGKVTFVRNFRREYITVDDEKVASSLSTPREEPKQGISSPSGNTFYIKKDTMHDALKNLNQILYDAASEPNWVDGKIKGFKILAITPGSLYEKLGIENGDVIHKVNGEAINTIDDVLKFFSALKTEQNFNLDIIRGEQTMPYRYVIE